MLRQILAFSAFALTAAPMIAVASNMVLPTPPAQASTVQAKASVNGRNVNYVQHSANGYYINHGNGKWFEGNAGNPTEFSFQEERRDDWSVYLFDSSRNVRIQLDIHRKKVIYSDASRQFDLYDITSAQSKKMINGGNVSSVRHSKGSYANRGNGQWVEVNSKNQVTFNFQETQRDEWSVYLLDSSRNVQIQLDLHRKKVIYSHDGQRFDLYDITRVSAK
jgi:hypothetical protein